MLDLNIRMLPEDGPARYATLGALPCSAPAPGEVHVWQLHLPPEDAAHSGAEDILSAAERARAARFRIEAVRQRYVLRRAALRTLLGCCLDASPGALPFVYGPHGKPGLEGDPPPLRFNDSVSGDMVLIALTRSLEIGVDIERTGRTVDHAGVARRFFHPAEQAYVFGGDDGPLPERFFRIWTRKEAVLKAAGLGLTVRLRDLSTVENYVTMNEIDHYVNYVISDLTLDGPLAGALACGAATCARDLS